MSYLLNRNLLKRVRILIMKLGRLTSKWIVLYIWFLCLLVHCLIRNSSSQRMENLDGSFKRLIRLIIKRNGGNYKRFWRRKELLLRLEGFVEPMIIYKIFLNWEVRSYTFLDMEIRRKMPKLYLTLRNSLLNQ